jgi:uncharacterized protein (DUF1697 family)
MNTFVALVRGINVGGKNILPMKDFRALLTSLGCEDVATYIQSGNAVFRSSAKASELSLSIADLIHSKFNFRPVVLVLTADDFELIAAETPFSVRPGEENLVHIWFLHGSAPKVDAARFADLSSASETFAQTRRAFYLHSPDGIGRSKLAAEVGKYLVVPVTARNFRTVGKIRELLAALQS